MEEAKFVVEELNKIFKTDYNMLSLDSKTRAEVLQLICDVLNYLDAMDKVRIVYIFIKMKSCVPILV